MRGLGVLLLFLISINFIYASCSEEQIDINEASLTELDKLSGIGPVKAQAIIDSRPFDSVDELIDVVGIGEATLKNIKEQGVACVKNEKVEEEDNQETSEEEDNSEDKNNLENNNYSSLVDENKKIVLEPINLDSNTKNIKSENDENLNTKSYAIYGLFGFCILLAFLFAFKKIKDKKYKNEFN